MIILLLSQSGFLIGKTNLLYGSSTSKFIFPVMVLCNGSSTPIFRFSAKFSPLHCTSGRKVGLSHLCTKFLQTKFLTLDKEQSRRTNRPAQHSSKFTHKTMTTVLNRFGRESSSATGKLRLWTNSHHIIL